VCVCVCVCVQVRGMHAQLKRLENAFSDTNSLLADVFRRVQSICQDDISTEQTLPNSFRQSFTNRFPTTREARRKTLNFSLCTAQKAGIT
jgi:hypothetical protein